ncbi:hypothetical protein LOZ61_006461 [Ophidiomyces ophidiicola]|nr:hypothetical protein LOZ61_006461 [Ophidiomyces ophidiicola]KAI1926667.1 hypothetical protein LOZ60_003482 [Ophidiomyces ophidiicola]KAI1968063.1 hypothetical protein LOZ59_000424 [Ophidiomyces ophidiicola]KAI1975634.1 hypothetical protein LOZ56_000542 [Ophidiomyces ophidiicola]KAI2004882.1 hypothetical protein LOZ49_005683 [Ophidiomyces ophidiicola]
MALPPEQIRIKRRREEEPVETLYIQPETRQTKRRFTDFVFQRVILDQEEAGVGSASNPSLTNERSTRHSCSRTAGSGPSVPIVRTGSPSPQLQDKTQIPASTPKAHGTRGMAVLVKEPRSRSSSAKLPFRPLPAHSAMRRFHIAAPATSQKVLHKAGGGVQKNKGLKHAVVVEQKGDVAKTISDLNDITVGTGEDINILGGKPAEPAPRKRRVVNEAERRWREQNNARQYQSRIQPDNGQSKKTGNSTKDDPSTWDLDSTELADELQSIAMEAASAMPVVITETKTLPPAPKVYLPTISPVLKYKPKLPKRQRGRRGRRFGIFDGADESGESSAADTLPPSPGTTGLENISVLKEALEEHVMLDKEWKDNDSDYVYDVFIRRPVQEFADDPKFLHIQQGYWSIEGEKAPTNIGVVVISEKDMHYWNELAEDDDDESYWNTGDEDSNAEDNPANEYPDEDLDIEDEFDDVNAAYNKYRRYGSDDEQYDMNEIDEHRFKPTTHDSSAEEASDAEKRYPWGR